MTDYEPVICDPLGGSDCLSRAVYNFSCLLCASRSVTAECFTVRVRTRAVSAGKQGYRPADTPCTLQWFRSFGFEPQETDQRLEAQFRGGRPFQKPAKKMAEEQMRQTGGTYCCVGSGVDGDSTDERGVDAGSCRAKRDCRNRAAQSRQTRTRTDARLRAVDRGDGCCEGSGSARGAAFLG